MGIETLVSYLILKNDTSKIDKKNFDAESILEDRNIFDYIKSHLSHNRLLQQYREYFAKEKITNVYVQDNGLGVKQNFATISSDLAYVENENIIDMTGKEQIKYFEQKPSYTVEEFGMEITRNLWPLLILTKINYNRLDNTSNSFCNMLKPFVRDECLYSDELSKSINIPKFIQVTNNMSFNNTINKTLVPTFNSQMATIKQPSDLLKNKDIVELSNDIRLFVYDSYRLVFNINSFVDCQDINKFEGLLTRNDGRAKTSDFTAYALGSMFQKYATEFSSVKESSHMVMDISNYYNKMFNCFLDKKFKYNYFNNESKILDLGRNILNTFYNIRCDGNNGELRCKGLLDKVYGKDPQSVQRVNLDKVLGIFHFANHINNININSTEKYKVDDKISIFLLYFYYVYIQENLKTYCEYKLNEDNNFKRALNIIAMSNFKFDIKSLFKGYFNIDAEANDTTLMLNITDQCLAYIDEFCVKNVGINFIDPRGDIYKIWKSQINQDSIYV